MIGCIVGQRCSGVALPRSSVSCSRSGGRRSPSHEPAPWRGESCALIHRLPRPAPWVVDGLPERRPPDRLSGTPASQSRGRSRSWAGRPVGAHSRHRLRSPLGPLGDWLRRPVCRAITQPAGSSPSKVTVVTSMRSARAIEHRCQPSTNLPAYSTTGSRAPSIFEIPVPPTQRSHRVSRHPTRRIALAPPEAPNRSTSSPHLDSLRRLRRRRSTQPTRSAEPDRVSAGPSLPSTRIM